MSQPGAAKKLYTIREAAELLRVSEWKVYRLLRDHELVSVRIGARSTRIKAAELDRFLAACEDTPA